MHIYICLIRWMWVGGWVGRTGGVLGGGDRGEEGGGQGREEEEGEGELLDHFPLICGFGLVGGYMWRMACRIVLMRFWGEGGGDWVGWVSGWVWGPLGQARGQEEGGREGLRRWEGGGWVRRVALGCVGHAPLSFHCNFFHPHLCGAWLCGWVEKGERGEEKGGLVAPTPTHHAPFCALDPCVGVESCCFAAFRACCCASAGKILGLSWPLRGWGREKRKPRPCFHLLEFFAFLSSCAHTHCHRTHGQSLGRPPTRLREQVVGAEDGKRAFPSSPPNLHPSHPFSHLSQKNTHPPTHPTPPTHTTRTHHHSSKHGRRSERHRGHGRGPPARPWRYVLVSPPPLTHLPTIHTYLSTHPPTHPPTSPSPQEARRRLVAAAGRAPRQRQAARVRVYVYVWWVGG